MLPQYCPYTEGAGLSYWIGTTVIGGLIGLCLALDWLGNLASFLCHIFSLNRVFAFMTVRWSHSSLTLLLGTLYTQVTAAGELTTSLFTALYCLSLVFPSGWHLISVPGPPVCCQVQDARHIVTTLRRSLNHPHGTSQNPKSGEEIFHLWFPEIMKQKFLLNV